MGSRKVNADAALERKLEFIEAGIVKAHGRGSIMVMGNVSAKDRGIEAISTGSLGVDHALGIGGLPRGRVVEFYGTESGGKTTLALHVIAEAQRSGGIAAFVDAEHALDVNYAGMLGVDIEHLLVSQPDHGEQALEICENLVRTGDVAVVVVDSVAALVPKAEIEGEMGDAHMGLQARLMSQALRKLTATVAKTRTLVIFINQLRMKIGVLFGCFHYNARIALADGGSMKIGKIVNGKLPVEVLSFDPETGRCVPAKVTGWHDNGNADYFLQVVTEGVGGSGRSTFGVTPNHILFAPVTDSRKGGPSWIEKPVSEFSPGDLVGHKALVQFTPLQRQLALASVLGDGSLRKVGNQMTQVRFGHGPQQTDYARWKEALMDGCVAWSGVNSSGGWSFDCRPSYDMTEVRSGSYRIDGTRALSRIVLRELTAFGVAVWAMDDGCFSGSYEKWGQGKFEISVKSYDEGERAVLARRLGELGCGAPTPTKQGTLLWSGERTRTLMEKIAPFVPPCMDYKLHPSVRGRYIEPEDCEQQDRYVLVPVKIVDIYQKPPTRSMRRFDLTVDEYHTYLVDGVAVHNSPETTTGGNALKFYASVRLDVRRIGVVKGKGGEEKVGSRVRVKVVKNKVAPPFRETEFEISYGRGIDKAGELLDAAVSCNLIEKSGAWFSVGGERIGQGRVAARDYLAENEAFAASLRDEVVKAMAAGTYTVKSQPDEEKPEGGKG